MQKVKTFIRHFSNDSLYRNSIYLIASTAVMSFFGFFFWLINARLYTTEEIGIATAMISITSLVTSFSVLGLNSGLIRFLSQSNSKNLFINSVFSIVGLTSFIIAVVYIIFIHFFSPSLGFIQHNIFMSTFFILFIAMSSVNTISDSVFIAYRSTKYILIYNTIYSITRVILPFAFIGMGAYGIFFSHSVGVLVALLLTLYFLIGKFDYRPAIAISKNIIKDIGKFSLSSYISSFIGGLPTMVFPVIILNKLGAATSAYYYMDMMIVGLIYIIPTAISQSLFAEISQDEKGLMYHIKKSVKINFLILIPAVVIAFFFGQYILLFFGKDYSTEGVGFLQLMALSALWIPVNYTFGVIFRIKQKLRQINIAIAAGTIASIVLSYFLISYKLYGIGISLILGQVVMAIVYALFTLQLIKKRSFESFRKPKTPLTV